MMEVFGLPKPMNEAEFRQWATEQDATKLEIDWADWDQIANKSMIIGRAYYPVLIGDYFTVLNPDTFEPIRKNVIKEGYSKSRSIIARREENEDLTFYLSPLVIEPGAEDFTVDSYPERENDIKAMGSEEAYNKMMEEVRAK